MYNNKLFRIVFFLLGFVLFLDGFILILYKKIHLGTILPLLIGL
ncbi:MAG: YdcF family protein, partial [Acinetobacter guillouiae]